MFLHGLDHSHAPLHHTASFAGCGCKANLPPPSAAVVATPAGCVAHLTCKPVHPPRTADSAWPWPSGSAASGALSSVGDALINALIGISVAGASLGCCIFAKRAIDKRREARKAEAARGRSDAEGRGPTTDGSSSPSSRRDAQDEDEDDDDDLRVRRG